MQSPRSQYRNSSAIVGMAQSDYGALYRFSEPVSPGELARQTFVSALSDAGIARTAVDGLIVVGSESYSYLTLAQECGLGDLTFLAAYPRSGRMCSVALGHAAMALQAGLASCIALVYSTNQRSAGVGYGSDYDNGNGSMYDTTYGLISPGARYALAYTRYMDLYGYHGREDLLSEIPITLRRHATVNPRAVMKTELSRDKYLSSRYIARPLRIFDFCLVNDGSVCLVMTTEERARDARNPAVQVAAWAEQSAIDELLVPPDYWAKACRDMASRSLDPVGLGPDDISTLLVYDNFSPSVLWALEGFGFCEPGTALTWIQGGRIALGGALPVNTSGGMLSEAFMQGWNLIAEGVSQLRGQAGARQIRDCSVALYCCLAYVASTVVLRKVD